MVIALKDALKLMRSGEPVNAEYFKADLSRNKAGELAIEPNLVVTGSSHDRAKNGTITMRRTNDSVTTIHTPLIMKVNGREVV